LRIESSDWACIAAAAAITTYDVLAREGQTISEAVDRYLIAAPLITELILAAIYLHVSNRLPSRLDPIHWAFGMIKGAHRVIG
jgi:hypothetical protein